jgi:2-haloacid dehalogenase
VTGFHAPSTGRDVRAVLFDTFGTVVDWRTGVATAVADYAARHGLSIDADKFADAWRARYQPSMEAVRSGQRPFTLLRALHRENLVATSTAFDFTIADNDIEDLNRAWERLPAWPDTVPGLQRLKRSYSVGPLSNGDTATLLHMAKFAGLPWDIIIGSDLSAAYKPTPEAYRRAAEILDLDPGELMLVAAHNDDLLAAQSAGLATGFVARPTEHGPAQTTDLHAEHDFDIAATNILDAAEQLTRAPVGTAT